MRIFRLTRTALCKALATKIRGRIVTAKRREPCTWEDVEADLRRSGEDAAAKAERMKRESGL